ncbi:hypothetical protein [Pseudomonas sp. 58 R 3]|nr:hypothetical protein [Pseudomonas sp. 58 R 3]
MPIALHVLQAERQGRLIDCAEHVAKEPFVLHIGTAQARLRHIVAVRHGVAQLLRLPQQEHAHFLLHHVERGVVHHQVMEHQQGDHTLVGLVMGIDDAHQRRLGQVQAIVTGVETFTQLAHDVSALRLHMHLLDTQYGFATDHLHRVFQTLPDQAGTQDVMAIDYRLQHLREHLKTLQIVKAVAGLQQVGVTGFGADMMVKHAFLQRCQRVDILHIRRAARDLRDDMLDARLIQSDQRQQFRGNARALGADQIGRHGHFTATAHRGGQRRQGRLAEQHTHVGAQVRLAHALDQVDGQQRMPAQFEEIVVAPDLLNLEHIGPDLREHVLHLALRRFVATAEQRVLVGCGQGFAVDLAVVSQRQAVQAHIGARHHVLRQLRLKVLMQRLEVDRATLSEIRHQALVPWFVLTGQYHSVLDLGVLAQACLDLAQFNAETTDFHLLVVTPQVLQSAVGTPGHQVAGAVHQAGVAERVGEECLRRQVGTVQIAQGDALATDIQLTGHTHRHRLLARIQHIGTAVADRPADGNAALLGRSDFKGGREGGGFGRSVAIEQVLRRAVFEYSGDDTRVEHIATDDQITQLCEHRQQPFGVLVEQAGSHPQHIHRFSAEQLGKQLAGQQRVLVDHHHRAAVEQGRPHVEGAGIKRRVGGKGHTILLIEIGVTVVDHQARNCPVRHQYAFWRAGGAGGVHDVRRRLGRLLQCQVAVGTSAQVQAVEVQATRARRRSDRGHTEQQLRPAVHNHKALTVQRRINVQRHIHGRAFADRQLAHQQVHGTFEQDRDALARRHAQADQVMGQAVGPCIQLGISHPLCRVHGGQCRRLPGRERFEKCVDGLGLRVVARRGVECRHHLLTLIRRQDRQRVQRGRGRSLQCLHQLLQCLMHKRAQALRTDFRQGQHGQAETVTPFIDVQGQWVVGTFFATKPLHALPGLLGLCRPIARTAMAIVEQCTEQRQRCQHLAAALRQGQRGVLMAQQRAQARMRLAYAGASIATVHVNAQRQGIDEHPQRPFGAFAAEHAAHQYRAENHVLLAGDTGQHLGPSQVEQAGGTDAQVAQLAAQAPVQFGIDAQAGFFDRLGIALHILQAERQRRFVDITQQLAEERFVLLLADPQARLGHIIAIGHRHRQFSARVQQVGLHFLAHHVQRGMVQGNVVEQQDRGHTLIGRVLGMHQLHHGRTGQVQAMLAGAKTLLQLGKHSAFRAIHHHLPHVQLRLAPHHLDRRRQALQYYCGAQDVMPVDHGLQRLYKRLQALAVGKAEARLKQIRIALLSTEVVVQNAFLQRCQRVDILHIGHATGHAGDDTVDAGLVQADQGQQVRGNALAIGLDAVGLNRHFTAVTHSRRQRRQRRLAEQHAHIGVQAGLAHAADQADRQQRMPAQFEEMVMAPDALDLEHICPNLRQGGFHFAQRRHIAAAEQGLVVRLRQGLAVQLAVGSQRQVVQPYIGRRHHVLRQLRLHKATQGFNVQRLALGEIGDEASVAGQYHGFTDLRMRAQAAVEFTQFDTHAADLHLVIVTPQVLQRAVRQPARQVAGAVHARLRRGTERIIDKTLGGHLRTVQITARHPTASDIQLTGRAQRHRLELCIKQVDLGVGYGFADVQGLPGFNHAGSRHHRGLGRAIVVDQGKRLRLAELAQTIAADQQGLERRVFQ